MRLYTNPSNTLYVTITAYKEEVYNEFKKRLFLALQKNQSSRKTRIVHHIIEKDLVELAVFSGDIKDHISDFIAKENKLLKIFLNVEYFADYNPKIHTLISRINNTIEKIEKEKTIISDFQIQNLKKLNEELDQYYQDFLDAFDYFKIIDGIYFEFLNFLLKRIFIRNITTTKKILSLNAEYLAKILEKIYVKSTKLGLDIEMKEKIRIITDYFILNYYYGDPVNVALAKIKKVYGDGAVEFLRKSNHLKIEKFDNILDILHETETLKIQRNIFEMFLKSFFGELGIELIKLSKQTFDSFICSLNHKNILFNSIPIDEKISFLIEELVLNEKSKIVLVQSKVPLLKA